MGVCAVSLSAGEAEKLSNTTSHPCMVFGDSVPAGLVHRALSPAKVPVNIRDWRTTEDRQAEGTKHEGGLDSHFTRPD